MRYRLDPFSATGISVEPETPPQRITQAKQSGNGYIGNAVKSVKPGTNVTVDNTDPYNPVVNATAGGGSAAWGGITGTLSSQTDLQTALNAKVPTTTTVNGHALSSNVSVTATDLSLGNVDNTSDATKNSATATLTNKRITKRVATLTDAATVTPDVDSYDGGKLLTLSQATTIANPTGTPTAFQQYVLRIKSTASQTLSFGTQYRGSSDVALPTATTGSSKTDYFGFQWNSDDSKFDLIALNRGF